MDSPQLPELRRHSTQPRLSCVQPPHNGHAGVVSPMKSIRSYVALSRVGKNCSSKARAPIKPNGQISVSQEALGSSGSAYKDRPQVRGHSHLETGPKLSIGGSYAGSACSG